METIVIWGLSEHEYKNLQQHQDFAEVKLIRVEESHLEYRLSELLGEEKQQISSILESKDFKNYVARAVKEEQPRILEMVRQPTELSLVLEKIKDWCYFLFDVKDLENSLRSIRNIIKKKQTIFSRITPLARYWYLSNYFLELQEEHMMMAEMHKKRAEQARALSQER